MQTADALYLRTLTKFWERFRLFFGPFLRSSSRSRTKREAVLDQVLTTSQEAESVYQPDAVCQANGRAFDETKLSKRVQVFQKGETALVELEGTLTAGNVSGFLKEIDILKSRCLEVVVDGRRVTADAAGRAALLKATDGGRWMMVDE
jgi:hypothetical protein